MKRLEKMSKSFRKLKDLFEKLPRNPSNFSVSFEELPLINSTIYVSTHTSQS